MTLLSRLTFLLGLWLWLSQSCLFGFIYFFWCKYLFYNGFPSIGKFWSCCCLSFHFDFPSNSNGVPVSWHSVWLFSCWLGPSLWSFERCFMRRYLKLSAFATSEFCDWVQVGIDVYISHCKYQAKPHLRISMVFSRSSCCHSS